MLNRGEGTVGTAAEVTPARHEVRSFYDGEFVATMLRDLARRNERQRAAIGLCRRFVPKGATVLEVGCGAGIITRSLQRRVRRLLAVDLSETNIEIARLVASGSNTTFAVLDIAQDPLPSDAPASFDTIVLADVIEHLPAGDRALVLRRLVSRLHADGSLVLSFPAPEYQQWLRANEPAKLQIVDEEVTPELIAAESGLRLVHVEYLHLWTFSNIYVHAVLRQRISVARGSATARLVDRARRVPGRVGWWLRNAYAARRIRRAILARSR
jgi:2-polyprenyl-3-methyl-5-hydroxy-6-metoxy-1,4-benzoquinol methylase